MAKLSYYILYMTKKIRYLILALGFVVFIILAPVIVLYVRGMVYDFKTHSFVSTGILAIRTDPKNADIYLNGKLKSKTSGDIKFLLPGEYEVTFKKQGYNDWTKRLVIQQSQVTWASPYLNKTYLLLKNPGSKIFDNSVLDFYNQNGQLTYLTADKLVRASASDINQKQTYQLPKPVNKILAVDTNGSNFILAYNTASSSKKTILNFNFANGQFTDISELFGKPSDFQFSANGQLFANDSDDLYQIDVNAKSKTLIADSVNAFYFQANDLYATQKISTSTELWISQTPYTQPQILIDSVPNFSSGNLFVTFEKQVLLLADGNLYLANSSMQKIADGVNKFSFDSRNSIFSILHYGELDYYGSLGQSLNFITRSSHPLDNLDVKSEIGYAFFSSGNEIDAIELDTHDSQNQYTLYTGQALQKFIVDETDNNIIILDGGELKIVKLR